MWAPYGRKKSADTYLPFLFSFFSAALTFCLTLPTPKISFLTSFSADKWRQKSYYLIIHQSCSKPDKISFLYKKTFKLSSFLPLECFWHYQYKSYSQCTYWFSFCWLGSTWRVLLNEEVLVWQWEFLRRAAENIVVESHFQLAFLHQDKQSYSVVWDYLGSLSNTVIRNSRSSLSSAFREEEVAMHFCIPTREYGTVPAPTTTTPTRCVISAVSSMTSNKSLFCIVDRSHNLQGLGEQWVSIKGEAEGGETKEREQRNPPTFDGHMDIGQPSVLSRVHHHVSTHSFAFDLQKWQQVKAPRDSWIFTEFNFHWFK